MDEILFYGVGILIFLLFAYILKENMKNPCSNCPSKGRCSSNCNSKPSIPNVKSKR